MVEWHGDRIGVHGILDNRTLRLNVDGLLLINPAIIVAVEMVASYGMPVGKEVFETVLQIGRLQEFSENRDVTFRLIYRLQVKQHLCHDSRAKDSNIRQALLDRFGPPGTKKAPGVLYGIKSHLWSALAVAVYAHDNPLP
jgi:hypothetical protein